MATIAKNTNLETFTHVMKERIDDFEAYWRKKQTADGKKDWPDTMPKDAWEEQLLAYLDF